VPKKQNEYSKKLNFIKSYLFKVCITIKNNNHLNNSKDFMKFAKNELSWLYWEKSNPTDNKADTAADDRNKKTILVNKLISNFNLFLKITYNPIKQINRVFMLIAVLPNIIENGIKHKKKLKIVEVFSFGKIFIIIWIEYLI